MDGWTWCPRVSGSLASHAAGYERWLVERGYGSEAVPKRVWQLAHLSRWLEQEGLSADRLTAERVEQFLAARRAAGYVTWVSSLSLRLPLEYLRELGVVAASGARISAGPVDRLLEVYASYLICERGLAASTIDGYERVARVFLEDRERRRGGLELDRLSAGGCERVSGFRVPRAGASAARVAWSRSCARCWCICT